VAPWLRRAVASVGAFDGQPTLCQPVARAKVSAGFGVRPVLFHMDA
jgi:hypothetical protein